MINGSVAPRLESAQRRFSDLLALNGGNMAGADAWERHQLVQEFFFHLIGAIEVLAQVVNEEKSLGIDFEDVTVRKVHDKLPAGDLIAAPLSLLYVRTRREAVPPDPYTDDAYIFRVYNYRHQVTHRGTNPFLFKIGASPPASFMLDPRDDNRGPSVKPVQEDMQRMLDVVNQRCDSVLALL